MYMTYDVKQDTEKNGITVIIVRAPYSGSIGAVKGILLKLRLISVGTEYPNPKKV